mmetsp:Transcript_105551/g.235614  ORF Transcript_105551/g.235614 Transcript_105551/m.235614 type:complete len:228 (-) Transcript_105551:81-764(-)
MVLLPPVFGKALPAPLHGLRRRQSACAGAHRHLHLWWRHGLQAAARSAPVSRQASRLTHHHPPLPSARHRHRGRQRSRMPGGAAAGLLQASRVSRRSPPQHAPQPSLRRHHRDQPRSSAQLQLFLQGGGPAARAPQAPPRLPVPGTRGPQPPPHHHECLRQLRTRCGQRPPRPAPPHRHECLRQLRLGAPSWPPSRPRCCGSRRGRSTSGLAWSRGGSRDRRRQRLQ